MVGNSVVESMFFAGLLVLFGVDAFCPVSPEYFSQGCKILKENCVVRNLETAFATPWIKVVVDLGSS